MAIFNSNPDPDFPVMNGPGFIQHTCNPYPQQVQQQQFYYNGQVVQPIMQPQMQMNGGVGQSRRFDAQPSPMAPTMPQASYGFNQLAEQSRRNMVTVPLQPAQQPVMMQPVQTQPQPMQTSPWAIPTQQQVQYQQFVPQQPDTTTMYDPRYSAIYQCHPSIDRKQGVWGNTEVCVPCMTPVVNWNGQPFATQQQTITYTTTYPQQVVQPMQTTWEQSAKQIWGKT